MSETGKATTDPRIERTRRAVREATLVVLGERGYAAFTIEAVADEARVARSTIYRHWPTRIALVSDALESLNQQPRPAPSGSTRQQVEELVVHLTVAFSDSVLSACMPALAEAAEHHPEVAAFLHDFAATRRQTLVDVLRAGIEARDLPAHLDPELAALTLVGPIVYRRFLTPDPLPPSRAADLVTQVLGPA